MKRKRKWLAIVLAVSLLGFGTALFLWPRDRITVESWQKIRIGMTEEEVAEILGAPGLRWKEWSDQLVAMEMQIGKPPFIDTGTLLQVPKGHIWVFFSELGKPEAKEGVRIWSGRRGLLLIEFDARGLVAFKQFQGVRSKQLNAIDRLRDWLGW